MTASQATKAFGSQLLRATQVCSEFSTGVVGNNNAILWTAVPEGVQGDSITIDLDNPGGNGVIAIVVTGTDIVVTLARAAGVISSTAAAVIAAIKADPNASALVSVQNDSTSTGAAAVVDTGGPQNLAGGNDTVTYAPVAEVQKIGGPKISLATTETTHLTSTGGYQEFLATLKQMAQFSAVLNFIPADDTQNIILGLVKDVRHGILRAFRFIFTDAAATTWDLSAFVNDFEVTGITPEGALQANITLRPSGQPTLA
jgi:hypothetical protein